MVETTVMMMMGLRFNFRSSW